MQKNSYYKIRLESKRKKIRDILPEGWKIRKERGCEGLIITGPFGIYIFIPNGFLAPELNNEKLILEWINSEMVTEAIEFYKAYDNMIMIGDYPKIDRKSAGFEYHLVKEFGEVIAGISL